MDLELNIHFAIIALTCILFFFAHDAYGHGGSSEIFPPVDLDGRQVTLEVSSSQDDTKETGGQQISISFLDFDSKITLRDVTFYIRAERGNQFLFEKEFKADSGFVVFNFISDENPVTLEETDGNLFGSILGLDGREIHVSGPKLAEGGLYKFDVTVTTADGYLLTEPLSYNAGISIPQTTLHEVNHPDYGKQNIQTITYYDELYDFEYDIDSKEISFSMPFEWTSQNIYQTSVVHQELVIPKTFGELLVSEFSMHINGIRLTESVITIDDYAPHIRTIHFIISQQELLNLLERDMQDGINFVIKPASEKTQISAITHNGQFRVIVSWEPERLESGMEATVIFDITDVFLKNKPVAVSYDFSATRDGTVIFYQDGTSTDSKDAHNTAMFVIADGSSRIMYLNFDNLDDSPRAGVSIPIIVDSIIPGHSVSIPSWVKESAGWWAAGSINDESFILGIEFLIQNDIILIPKTQQADSLSQNIPSWVKESAGWWAAGSINDGTFVTSLQFLIEYGILRV